MNKEIPKNIDAEQSVIGSMFLTKKAMQKVLENLKEDSFYLDSHKKIFSCIYELDSKGKPVDLTTVVEVLVVDTEQAQNIRVINNNVIGFFI